MDAGLAVVVAASVSAVGGIVAVLLQGIKKETRSMATENREDHAVVQMQLRMIYKGLNKVDDKLERHIQDHREGDEHGETIKADRNNAS